MLDYHNVRVKTQFQSDFILSFAVLAHTLYLKSASFGSPIVPTSWNLSIVTQLKRLSYKRHVADSLYHSFSIIPDNHLRYPACETKHFTCVH